MCLSIRRKTFLLSSIIQNFTVKLVERETIIYANSYNIKVSLSIARVDGFRWASATRFKNLKHWILMQSMLEAVQRLITHLFPALVCFSAEVIHERLFEF